jgi:hypothetical protein
MKEVEKALEIAHHRASSTGTGSNEQNTMMQEIRKIRDNNKRLRGYKPEETAQMEKIVDGTIATTISRYLGRFAPVGLHSTMGLAFVSKILSTPIAAAAGATAYAAKKIGDVLTRHQVERLITMIQERAPVNARQAVANQATRATGKQESLASTLRQGAVAGGNAPDTFLIDSQGSAYDALGNAQ